MDHRQLPYGSTTYAPLYNNYGASPGVFMPPGNYMPPYPSFDLSGAGYSAADATDLTSRIRIIAHPKSDGAHLFMTNHVATCAQIKKH
jgi:hypothetical protein